MEHLMAQVTQSGFAVAVALWLLVRTETRLEALTEAIQELQIAIVALSEGSRREGKVTETDQSH